FFSSRRWHTRFSRDWSSDVCSSDLPVAFYICRDDEEAVGSIYKGIVKTYKPNIHAYFIDIGEETELYLHESDCLDASEMHVGDRSEEHTSELQSRENLVCRLLLEKK